MIELFAIFGFLLSGLGCWIRSYCGLSFNFGWGGTEFRVLGSFRWFAVFGFYLYLLPNVLLEFCFDCGLDVPALQFALFVGSFSVVVFC